MARKSKQQLRDDTVKAVVELVKDFEEETQHIRIKWRDNHQMFECGTVFEGKADWQSDFSINKLGNSIRAAQAKLKRILIHNPDWFDLNAQNPSNPLAVANEAALKKLLKYHLDAANFKRYASTYILQVLLSLGCMFVGWQRRRIPNPEYVQKQADKYFEKQREQNEVEIANGAALEVSPGEMEDLMSRALQSLQGDLQGVSTPKEEDTPKELEVGGLQLEIPIAENTYFDPNVPYIENSEVQSFRTTVRLHVVKELAKRGRFNKKEVARLEEENSQKPDRTFFIDRRYKHRQHESKTDSNDVDLLTYFGPLIIDGEVRSTSYFCIIANDKYLLAEGENPFWEPRGHKGPMVMASAREVPHKSVGAGIGDTAVPLQRALDSNYTLLNDAMRFGVVGINVVKATSLIDKTILEEGIEPGSTIATRESPKDSFQHVTLTSNIENQVKPINLAIEQGIEDDTGVSSLLTGGNNLRSRTTAAEISARQAGSEGQVDSVAVDIETQFLVPFLEKALARIIQFGLKDLRTNPEVQNVLSEDEIERLSKLTEGERNQMMFSFYAFKIKGFSHQQDNQEKLQRFNELFQIGNSGGPLQQLLPWQEALKQWFIAMDMNDLSEKVNPFTEQSRLSAENALLLSDQDVEVLEGQDHQMHMQSHQQAAMGSQMTEAMQLHLQQHRAIMQMEQQAQAAEQQAQAQGALPPQLQ